MKVMDTPLYKTHLNIYTQNFYKTSELPGLPLRNPRSTLQDLPILLVKITPLLLFKEAKHTPAEPGAGRDSFDAKGDENPQAHQ